MPAIAHYTAAAAVITAIPAIVTGLGEGYELIRNQYMIKGTWAKVLDDAWNMRDDGGKKVYMTVKHASMNDAVVALAAFNWYAPPTSSDKWFRLTRPGFTDTNGQVPICLPPQKCSEGLPSRPYSTVRLSPSPSDARLS
jgi:hypothetical protein